MLSLPPWSVSAVEMLINVVINGYLLLDPAGNMPIGMQDINILQLSSEERSDIFSGFHSRT